MVFVKKNCWLLAGGPNEPWIGMVDYGLLYYYDSTNHGRRVLVFNRRRYYANAEWQRD